MTRFYICRHGETENNKAGRFSGWIDTPLTAGGILNAEAVATKLQRKKVRPAVIIASDLGRAFTTAYIIARRIGYQAEIERRRDLREVDYGDFSNQPYAGYPAMTPEHVADFIHPGGESLKQMQQRVLACIADIGRRYPDQTVLIVAHDGTINAVRASFHSISIGVADKDHSPHDYLGSFRWHDGRISEFTDPSLEASRC